MKLTGIEVRKATIDNGKTKKVLFDGDGLRLELKGKNKSWVYRVRRDKKEYNIHLGSYPVVNLQKARQLRKKVYKYILKLGVEDAIKLFMEKDRKKQLK